MKSAEITHTTLLVLDGCNTLTLAAAVDPLRAANRQAGRPLYEWHFATPRDRAVQLTSGLEIPAAPIHKMPATDLLIIVAGFAVEAQTTPQLTASLRRIAAQGAIVAGIDGGPWVMARAGILDGHSATTHWEDFEGFSHNFPAVELINTRYQVSGKRLTSAGAAPALEMMLHLIGDRHGATLAGRIATAFIFDPAPPRPQSRAQNPRHSRLTARAQQRMEAALETPLPLRDIAAELGVSDRALQQQFRTHLGVTPQAHYLALRLSQAERLVRDTRLPLQEIALNTGFGSPASFARAFRTRFQMSASQMRQRTGKSG
ncbi:GlxA family transcriptional regulator [Sulfitobacter sp. PR48]|uniref:GlxA family transcriptional regulator n=1 Tax=Sulfitobacter sp. PR48 TaxID=3028383 RepID=UPI00237B0E1D|nr:GlxA family transcriptional regulator [Sulfitobacter sp. PR48]MDD9722403.1 GlxA family transcriptional regulator [Sulfitobacter sp. PR48]